MVEAIPTKFSYFTQIPYLSDHPECTRPKQLSSSQFRYSFYLLTVSGKFQHGWVVGAGGRQDGSFKFFKEEPTGEVYVK